MTANAHSAIGIIGSSTASQLASFSRPTPRPGPEQVLAKTLLVGHTPLSQWQVDFRLFIGEEDHVLGGNVVGEILEVGAGVRKELRVGSIIMGFQFALPDERPNQELVLVNQHNACLVPGNISLHEAATIPDSFVTAYHSLATELGVPLPLSFPSPAAPTNPGLCILIWGGASTSGMFAIQILRAAGYTNILSVSSARHFPLLASFGASATYDYASPDIARTLSALDIDVALDCIGDEATTVRPIAAVVKHGARVGVLLPVRKGGYGSTEGVTMDIDVPFADGVRVAGIRTHFYQRNEDMKNLLQPKIMNQMVALGLVKPVPFRVMEGGSILERTEKMLEEYRSGNVRGEKILVDWRA